MFLSHLQDQSQMNPVVRLPPLSTKNYCKQQQTMPRHYKLHLFLSEFICTFMYTFLSQCALASLELTGTQNDVLGRKVATSISFGLAYLFAQLTSSNLIPAAAITNPALTFACATFKLIRWSQVPFLLAGQYLGAFIAAPILHATFNDKLDHRHEDGLLSGMNSTLKAHGNILSTGKFFTSFPPTEVTLTQLFISYTLATCFLSFIANVIMQTSINSVDEQQLQTTSSVTHRRNCNRSNSNYRNHNHQFSTLPSTSPAILTSRLTQVPHSRRPFYTSSALVLVLIAFEANGGPVVNPAQDFSPRLYISIFGWGASAFNLYHFSYWWFCCILAPHLGACIGLVMQQILFSLSTNACLNINGTHSTHHCLLRNRNIQNQYTHSHGNHNHNHSHHYQQPDIIATKAGDGI